MKLIAGLFGGFQNFSYLCPRVSFGAHNLFAHHPLRIATSDGEYLSKDLTIVRYAYSAYFSIDG